MKSLKKKIKGNKLTIGSWITLGHPAIAEIMANAGFDWLTIDMEHSAITLSEAQRLIRVIDLAGSVPLVRVGSNDANLIKRVLDAGSHGIIVPMVNSKEDARCAVKAAMYPPDGVRGVGLARAQKYGLGFEAYKRWAKKNLVVVVQIEHINAIENLEEILETEGVDASIIGPYDLSASLGHPGDFKRKELKDALKKYARVCKKLKKPPGFHVIPPSAAELEDKIKGGFRFLSFSLDTLFLGEKIKVETEKLNKKRYEK